MCSATGLLAKVERATLICDQTGCGRPICDLFRARLKGKLVAVTITGGHETTVAGDSSWHVPKKNLVSAVQAALQTDRLKIARALREARTLRRELRCFR